MTLTARLNRFFLSALAVVLIGFSSAIYLLAREHLNRQADDQLDAAIHILSATVEVTPSGVEWEPTERRMSLGARAKDDSVFWLVTDSEGHVVDSAGPASLAEFATEAAKQLQTTRRSDASLNWDGQHWQFRQLWIESPGPVNHTRAAAENERLYQALGLTVGFSLEPIRTTLRELAVALAGLSILIWFAAMIAGRIVCRRALRPVARMAAAASEMEAAQLEKRLPLVHSGDELEALGLAFNGLLDRVQDAFERQQRFTGDASHQLRTPLTVLLGEVEVALRRERSNEEYQRVLGSVHHQTERLRQIVESLLFLARADAEAQLPQRERIDLARWLPSHLQMWNAHPRSRDLVSLVKSAFVSAQPVLLGELLNILIDNALKHSSPGSPVTIRIDTVDGAVDISVEDRGTGIRSDELPHLFEPFFRSPTARLQGVEGIGLGLSVARRIAAAFGGSLSASSQLGEGSRFALRLAASRDE